VVAVEPAPAGAELSDAEYADLVARIEEIYASFLPALEAGDPDDGVDADQAEAATRPS
jgi:hypothetical protein